MMEQSYNSEPMTKEDFLSQGINLYREKRYDEAIYAYEQAIKLDPNYALAFYGKGLVLGCFEWRKHEEALCAFECAIQLSPGYFRSHKGRGDILCKLNRYDEALASYEEVIRLNPYHAQSYRAKGDALYCLEKKDEAFAAFDCAIDLDPENASVYEYKAYLLAYEGFADEALEVYDKLFSIKPNHVESYIKKAEIYRYFTDNHLGALGAYNQAISVDRKYVKAYQYKAALFFDDRLYGLAVDVYDRIIHLVPNDSAMHFWRGAALLEANRYEEALADFERVIQLDINRHEEALADDFEDVFIQFDILETDVLVLYSKGKALCRCSRYKEALVEFKKALQLFDGATIYSSYSSNSFSYKNKEGGILYVWIDDIYAKMCKLLLSLENSQELLTELRNCYNQRQKEFHRSLFADDEVKEHNIESEFTFLEPWESGDDNQYRDQEPTLGEYTNWVARDFQGNINWLDEDFQEDQED